MSSRTPQDSPPPPARSELGRAARGGAITFVGAASSAALGFTFSLLLARLFGPTDAGVVLQSVALFTIAVSVARLGTDTTAVWLLPRLRTQSPHLVPAAITLLLTATASAGAVLALVWYVVGAVRPSDDPVREVVDAIAWLLPVASGLAVALACTRAFGGIVAFNLVDNVLVPAVRPLALVVAHLLGAAALGAALGWALPVVLGAGAIGVVLHRHLRRLRRSLPANASPSASTGGREVPRWPDRQMRRTVAAYAVPRTFAAAMEQSIVWIGVLLVGMLLDDAAAGVYGSAARFVAAGVVVATALRIVVAPRFSALLGQGRTSEVGELYVVTARWILLFGAPVYLTLAFFAPTVLAWLGEGFGSGARAMTILCAGSVVVLAAGNVQALLLMSGRSGWGALNKAVVLAVNVVGMVLWVPSGGIEAAAAVWALSMLLDTVLASVQVRRATGIALSWTSVLRVGLAVTACVALPAWAVTASWGQGTAPLLVSIGLGATLLAGYVAWDRRTLHLTELVQMVRR
ncbi:oligosaccharide flippase family protein [Nocardioides sp. Y6]|uniref:Oligosaccharide flippase family protein n=1 Tax=Nocardioides malaquae TaxID=2773426 RepID=A0ABR9RQZ2_9ACTN|nr:oligosaccharide flippase family protein [Nocardioides malaquae]MBE7323979.1 oligosaccharide flippase family protein [Nocardioides malaquae]